MLFKFMKWMEQYILGIALSYVGLPVGPALYYKNNNAIVTMQGFGYGAGGSGPIGYAYTLNNPIEFYAVEPVIIG